LKVSEEIETPRLWLMDEEESHLIQLQQDRLVVNWRKGPKGAPYPHYDDIRDSLKKAWGGLEEVVRGLGRPLPSPSICEVLYVNHFDEHSGWSSASDTPRVIAPWGGSTSDSFLPPPSEAALSMLFELPEGRGWLAVDGRSGRLGPRGSVMTLNLIARGRTTSPGLHGALAFMDLAHEWIVQGFTSITTVEAHERWRRKR
ncbi:MAG: TIGR04255 family protein, partial [Chloroflexi bacterium]|nr:TIGR04255 family protein [Chloroflexota bacterium]